MTHYKCIILVIASNNTEYYKNARRVWKKYMNINPDVKVFFVYEELTDPLEDSDDSDIVYNDIKVQPNSILVKTLRAMYAINKYYSYDYFIRTNISTFWDFKRIQLLLDQCPKTACYAGGHDLSPYLIYDKDPYVINTHLYSGVCIILTPDIVQNILNNIHKLNFGLPDDISIGLYMSNVECNAMTYTSRAYYEKYGPTDDKVIISEITKGIQNNYAYYRVKNENNREHTDSMIYNYLLTYVYNIT
jgi:hypothetical protein